MKFIKNLFKWEEKPKCNHSIGDNWSQEVYVWKGRDETPYKHYVTYTCELCGEKIKNIHNDATMKYSDAINNRY